jgi:succinate-semialdehyde dehydrogenase/glutarate-semialdehyde dehydrogenase
MKVINPATEEVIDEYEEDNEDDLYDALDIAEKRFETWSERSLQDREKLLSNAADVLRDGKQRYAEIMTKEMGKPISQSISEVEKCAWLCDHYAENAGNYLQDDVYPSPPGSDVRTVYDPLGVVLAVMPWNFPFWQVFRFAAPYLTVGNVGLLKHASNVPGCALAIQEVFEKAGYPEGAFQSLLVGSSDVEKVVNDSRVKAVTLTGSGPAGSAVAEQAGSQIKKSVLELGGSDPYVVLQDANLEKAVEKGVWARNQNGGQSCIAAKRFMIVEDVYDEFLDRLKSGFQDLNVGDPTNENIDVGPQSDEDLMQHMHEQVQTSVGAGANLVLGGEPMDRKGFYYPPTILTDVPEGCPADQDEIFGPVAAVYKVEDQEEAIRKANDTDYGLGASIWTQDTENGREVASKVEAGCVYVNEMVKSDPRVPFGGIGISGYGRELSEIGIKEFTNKKTVWLEDN